MLATLAVVLWAYGMYALFSYIFHRQGGQVRSRSRRRKLGRLALVGGVTAGVGLIFWCCLYPDKHDQRLKLTGFLGTVYAEGWPDRVDRLKEPPVKSANPGASEQPAYALLHPETPVSQVGPEKKFPRPRPSRVASKGPYPHLMIRPAKSRGQQNPGLAVQKGQNGRQEPRQEKEPVFCPGGQAGRCRLRPRAAARLQGDPHPL